MRNLLYIPAVFILSTQISCSPVITIGNSNTVNNQILAEPSYCSNVTSYAPSITITGNAVYEYRQTDLALGLDGDPIDIQIPLAEITVVNSAGTVVQCGLTNSDGTFSLEIPKSDGSYILHVASRSNSTNLKVSVLNDISNNQPYKISKSFSVVTADVSKAIGTLTAIARQSVSSNVEAGAFNILFNIHLANEYLRAEVIGIDPPKSTIYWKAGFNPANYFGSSSPVSFYVQGSSKIYILGGTGGDVATQDTDHFDDSIVIHEYAHFLEDVFSISDSQGGSHNGNSFIDPRLAWSEGWANFFQSAVLATDTARGFAAGRENYYIDTVGFSDDSVDSGELGYIIISVDLTESGAIASQDSVSQNDEGVFREISVSRTLLKTIAPLSAVHPFGANIPFDELWTVFTSAAGSNFGNSSVKFRNSGNFFELLHSTIQASYAGSTASWAAIVADERQSITPKEYNNLLVAQAPACGISKIIDPVVDSSVITACQGSNTIVGVSNTLRSSDFFRFVHDGSAQSIRLDYTQDDPSDPDIDLDLIVYRDDYLYYDDFVENHCGVQNSTIAVRSRAVADGDNEQVSLAGLPAGSYQVQVKANTYGKNSAALVGAANYSLILIKNSDLTERNLCPSY